MTGHRTTARVATALLALAGVFAGVAAAHEPSTGSAAKRAAKAGPAPIVFPVVGSARYTDDYGDSRANGAHQGNDIVTDWRTPAVAAEEGRVKWWTTSSRAGCMLYLYGASGTTYLYIHLNNDLTHRRDNRGRCELGTAYAVKDGARVAAGEVIGWNGDSGDAEGTFHLHFEVHPKDGDAVNPYPSLQAAQRLLFPGRIGAPFTLGLRGVAVAAGEESLELAVTAVRWWPGGRWTALDRRSVVVAVPQETAMDKAIVDAVSQPTVRKLSSRESVELTVFTTPAALTAEAQRGEPGALVAARVVSR
jgi:hypothetical protein